MSAFCSTRGRCVMSTDLSVPPLLSITARPTPEEKRQFAELAAQRGMSESKLALAAIRILLQSNARSPSGLIPGSRREPASDRITIRLRPGDRGAVRERAKRRGLRDSAYLAALVRAHVVADPPLAVTEIAALKTSVTVLAGLGRLLARMAREGPRDGIAHQEELRRLRSAVAALEHQTHDLVRASLVSWESHYG